MLAGSAPQQPDRAVAYFGEFVVRVGQLARLHRQAPAADAVVQRVAEPFQPSDPGLDGGTPGARESRPVRLGRGPFLRQRGEGSSDLRERDADALRGTDEADPAEHFAVVATLIAGVPGGGDQAFALIEMQSRDGNTSPPSDFAGSQVMRRKSTLDTH